MSYEPNIQSIDPQPTETSVSDPTGQEGMTRNVLASWAGHLVVIVAGFVMPRLIDGYIGQEALGVWDFAWSLVVYFSLAQGGIVSSINRYVAKHRATGDMEGLNRSVSSVSCVLLVIGLAMAGLTVAVTLALPGLLGDRLGGHVRDAQWVVFLLGVSLALQTVFSVFGGVLTGCHRWDLHNAILAGSNIAIVAGMIGVLILGGRLSHLALVNLCGDLAGRLVRCVAAYRVCPGLSVRLRHARWAAARNMMTFGGKSFIPQIAELLLNQTTNILIVVYVGPAALALYARPKALVRHVRALVQKFAQVMGPTASSLQARGQQEALRELLVKSTRYAACITFPMLCLLVIQGDLILRLWMGPRYEQGLVLTILAVGYLATITQQALRRILVGINAHGRPGLANLAASVCAVALLTVALGPLQWGLAGVALCIAVPITISNGIYMPVYACRRLDMPIGRYLLDTLRAPALCVIPFGLCLVAGRALFAQNPLAALACGLGTGSVVLAWLYQRYIVPLHVRAEVTRWVARALRRAPMRQA